MVLVKNLDGDVLICVPRIDGLEHTAERSVAEDLHGFVVVDLVEIHVGHPSRFFNHTSSVVFF